jgi:hypothetical protein
MAVNCLNRPLVNDINSPSRRGGSDNRCPKRSLACQWLWARIATYVAASPARVPGGQSRICCERTLF